MLCPALSLYIMSVLLRSQKVRGRSCSLVGLVAAKKEGGAQHENVLVEADAESREMRRWNARHFFGISLESISWLAGLFVAKIRLREGRGLARSEFKMGLG